jgi:hypothetical protein
MFGIDPPGDLGEGYSGEQLGFMLAFGCASGLTTNFR